jgi:hypothetical protein
MWCAVRTTTLFICFCLRFARAETDAFNQPESLQITKAKKVGKL